ncbi:MAG TPA: type II toxin-antitoxin system PemK/MazF family toxin [Terriglobales bacterium]|nr:type II toxin-antitoxin system PemK/MazF family toxin [Terriglobales bacterium]
MNPKPQRGEIWTAHLADAPKRHWVVVVSLDGRNLSDRASTVLIVPFGSYGVEGPTTMLLPAGETGLPGPSYLKAHFIQVLEKKNLLQPQRRMLSSHCMRKVVEMIRRAVDPEAPWPIH